METTISRLSTWQCPWVGQITLALSVLQLIPPIKIYSANMPSPLAFLDPSRYTGQTVHAGLEPEKGVSAILELSFVELVEKLTGIKALSLCGQASPGAARSQIYL